MVWRAKKEGDDNALTASQTTTATTMGNNHQRHQSPEGLDDMVMGTIHALIAEPTLAPSSS